MAGAPASTAVVVMPTRDQARHVDAALDSILLQGGCVERVLVQDGGSRDGTLERLQQRQREDSRIEVLSAPDDGPADALNRVFARALAAGASTIGWLNSDDLYTPGAVGRALAHLEAHPALVAVYGEGEHIDADGQPLGRYPTRGPDEPRSHWRDGCPVCQPTMFLRREALQALLPLDTGLRTAFDFDLWCHLFAAYPGRIGRLDAVQALSRLHADGITTRLRQQVVLESMAVVHRHFGSAPPHWLATHVGESLADCPFSITTEALQAQWQALAARAAPFLAPGGVDEARRLMQATRTWQLMRPGFVAAVSADGWAGPELELRLRQRAPPGRPVERLRLRGRHAWPRPGRWRLRVGATLDNRVLATTVAWWRRRFVLDIPVPVCEPGVDLVFRLHADDHFVPARVNAGSNDHRRLAYQVEAVELLPAA